jgi:hypothetical protein
VALGCQIVDFVGLYLLENSDQVGGVCQISIVKDEISVFFMGILVEVVYSVCIKEGGPSFDSVDFISFLEKELCKVCPVLAGDSCY